MTSEEYAMYQQINVRTGPIYAAKTAALFNPEAEDFIIEGERVSCLAMFKDGTTLILPSQSYYRLWPSVYTHLLCRLCRVRVREVSRKFDPAFR